MTSINVNEKIIFGWLGNIKLIMLDLEKIDSLKQSLNKGCSISDEHNLSHLDAKAINFAYYILNKSSEAIDQITSQSLYDLYCKLHIRITELIECNQQNLDDITIADLDIRRLSLRI